MQTATTTTDSKKLEDACFAASHTFNFEGDNLAADYSCLDYGSNQMVVAIVNGPFETYQSVAAAGGATGDSPGSCAEEPEALTAQELGVMNKNGLLDDIMSELDDATDLIINTETEWRSYCSHYFGEDKRFILGTHRAVQDDMDNWAGDGRHSVFVS